MWEGLDAPPAPVAAGDAGDGGDAAQDAAHDMDFDFLNEGDVPGASMDVHIPASNVGYKLALKMGWKAGTGLGRAGQGRTDPIRLDFKQDTVGLGRWEMESEMAEKTTEKRRLLEAEMEVTPELLQKWQNETEKKEAITSELKEVTKAFYCETCDKQYTKVTEFSNHLSSYDHHHTKRLKEMRERESRRNHGDVKRKEHRKEERELRRLHEIASAMAAKQQRPPAAPQAPPPDAPAPVQPPLPSAAPPPLPSAAPPPLPSDAPPPLPSDAPPPLPSEPAGGPGGWDGAGGFAPVEQVAGAGVGSAGAGAGAAGGADAPAPRVGFSFSMAPKSEDARAPVKFGFGFKKK